MSRFTLKHIPARFATRRRRSMSPAYANLINAESRLGGTIFGPIPYGHRREFFRAQDNIWIWYESWSDYESTPGSLRPIEHPHEQTIRFEVRRTGVYKKIGAGKYYRLEGAELANFRKAAKTYLKVVKEQLYSNNLAKIAN